MNVITTYSEMNNRASHVVLTSGFGEYAFVLKGMLLTHDGESGCIITGKGENSCFYNRAWKDVSKPYSEAEVNALWKQAEQNNIA